MAQCDLDITEADFLHSHWMIPDRSLRAQYLTTPDDWKGGSIRSNNPKHPYPGITSIFLERRKKGTQYSLLFWFTALMIVAGLLLNACGPTTTKAPDPMETPAATEASVYADSCIGGF